MSEHLLDAAQPPCASLTLGMMWWTWLRHSSWGAVCNISTSSRGQGGAADGPEAPPERAVRAVLTRQRARAACGCAGMPRAAGRTAPATGIDLT